MSTRAHLVVAIGALAVVVFILRLVGRRQLRSKYALLWLAIGALLVPLAAFPRSLEAVSRWMGVSYAPTTFLLLALGFLLLVVVHLSWELSRLETRLRTLAEELALLRSDGDDGDVSPSRD